MVARLEKVDSGAADSVNQAMLLRDSSRPTPSEYKFQGFGLANAAKRIPNDGFHEFHYAQSGFSIVINPVP
jgi:hypothetical protein